jgi:hypothetical protein
MREPPFIEDNNGQKCPLGASPYIRWAAIQHLHGFPRCHIPVHRLTFWQFTFPYQAWFSSHLAPALVQINGLQMFVRTFAGMGSSDIK